MRLATLAVLALLAPGAGTANGAWRQEGPAIGTVYDVAIDPKTPSTVYALTWNGGLWRSDDGGRSWALPSTELVGRTMVWLEIDPADPATLWAGEKDPGEPALWRSKDRGATWKLVRDQAAGTSLPMHPVGYRIAFAPKRPADIWVPSTNLHYRSRDGGKSWSDFRVPGQDAYAIAVDPANPDVVYAGGHGGENLHLSRSDDAGRTWKPTGIGLGPGLRELVVDSMSTIYAHSGGPEIWKSTDGGSSFTPILSPVSGTDDIFRLQVDPSNPKTLFAATEAGLKRSPDGGASWQESDRGIDRYLVRSVAFDPRGSRTMLAAVSGTGVHRSTDGGVTWAASNGGLSAAWIERLEGSPRNATLYARASVGLFRRDGAGEWTEVQAPFASGEKATPGLFFDRKDARGLWAFETATLWRSTNDGLRWDEVPLKEPSMRDLLRGMTARAGFRSFVQDAGNPLVFYAGTWATTDPGLSISKSTDGGRNWKPSAVGLPGEEVDLLLCEAAGVVFAVVGEQQLYRSDDAAASWKALESFPEERLRRLVIDPTTPSRLFAATEKGLFRSADSGASWTKVGGAIEKEDVEDVVASGDGRLFAAHFHGVSVSADGGSSWSAVALDGLPNHDVRALAVFGASGTPPRLAAGTAGNGVFSVELP